MWQTQVIEKQKSALKNEEMKKKDDRIRVWRMVMV